MEEREPMQGRAKFLGVSPLTFLVSTLQTGRTDELILCYICVCHNIGHSKIQMFLNAGTNFAVYFVQMFHACHFDTRSQYQFCNRLLNAYLCVVSVQDGLSR